ncbi:MAG TPA: aldolase/citrate lyase family protein [Alphaproteobacteria bacterium]|jgi:2-keto-3-deoxy-L-rhamnonate aldolase RhmA
MAGEPSNENALLRKLATNRSAICMPIRMSRSAHIVAMAQAAGFDAIYMDMEQSDIPFDAISNLSRLASASGVTPLVRVPTVDPLTIGRVLSGGAGGIIVPHVNTVEDARTAVAAARFPPLGQRATAGVSLALSYAPLSAMEAEKRLDRQTMVIVMIESGEAVANAAAIAAVPGIDMLLVGTGDLGRDLGVHGQHQHPKIRDAYAAVAAACHANKRWLGVAGIKGVAAAPILKDLYRLGARFISARTDEALLLSASRDEAAALRELFAE